VSQWNPGLTLLYFHTPHEDVAKDKLAGQALATFRQCALFGDAKVVRWLQLLHCVEVDMGASDAKKCERLGAKDGAIFAIIDQDLNVIATTKPVAESDNVTAFLKSTLKSEKAAKYWAPIQTQIDEQKATLEKARALANQHKYKESLEQYKLILASPVRISDSWDTAAKESQKIARKAADDK